jgi:Probable zinc-ribbon domain
MHGENNNQEMVLRKVNRDLICVCVDCWRDFTVTEGERQFYAFKKLSTPKRCPACRKIRKARDRFNITGAGSE